MFEDVAPWLNVRLAAINIPLLMELGSAQRLAYFRTLSVIRPALRFLDTLLGK